jgi:hypothetical protein
MGGHPGVIGVRTAPPAPAGVGPRELRPGLEGAGWRTGDPSPAASGASQGSRCGVARCQ